MKPKLLSCLAVGTLLAVTVVIVILNTSYGKSLTDSGSSHISSHRGFQVSMATGHVYVCGQKCGSELWLGTLWLLV